jgi:alkaline phosphatase D
MRDNLTRRSFLHVVAATAAPGGLLACGDEAGETETTPGPGEDPSKVFPLGVASGDPKPDSVVLWVRVEPSTADAVETVDVDVATDEGFAQIVATQSVETDADSDHTVRVKVTKLEAFKTYYYRFRARGVASVTGRTKTAPAKDQDVPVRFAFASCQDFNGRYYHAWRALVEQEDEVDFVVYLGDYIYETTADPQFQTPAAGRSITLPDGKKLGEPGKEFKAALSLADYRSLYRQYRSDQDLQEAHRLHPFVCIWDDHEFANDCWQDHSTDFNEAMGDEKDPKRRQAASRAWFEYQPADVEYDGAAGFPKDIRIYRSLRYGKHLELFLTDQRYYRSDHVIKESEALVPNTALGSRVFVLKKPNDPMSTQKGFDEIEKGAGATMLGAEQKQWLVDGLKASDATWKLWGSETQLAQQAIDLSDVMMLPDSFKGLFYFSTDQWDGYRSERAEILDAVKDVENLVVVTGDIHAFYAAELHVDFDAPATPTAVEYVVAGIASQSLQEIVQKVVETNDLLKGLGLAPLVPELDQRFQKAGPHYKYAKSLANGIGVAEVEGQKEMRVTFLLVGDVTKPDFSGKIERVSFRTPAGTSRIDAL